MGRPTLLRRLFFAFLIVTVLCFAAFGWYVLRSLDGFFLDQLTEELETEASLISHRLREPVGRRDMEEVDRICREMGRLSRWRVSVVLPSGDLLGDSLRDPERMGNWSSHPEVRSAMRGRTGTARRTSPITGRERLYLAKPLNGGDIGMVRIGVPLAPLRQRQKSLMFNVVVAGLGLAVVVAGVYYLVSRRMVKPLEKMTRGARRFAEGNLDYRLPLPDTQELAGLAETLNQMAGELSRRIGEETRQRRELRAVLDSMEEGVVAIGEDRRVFELNPAAALFLGTSPDRARGQTLYEVVRNARLQRVIDGALRHGEAGEEEVQLNREDGLTLHARITPVPGEGEHRLGGVLMLQDVTRLRRLERVRKDFVANVTHELKTPITSIKGFVETLLDGAYREPERAERFLKILDRQVGRLNDLIEDLLVLSRLEEQRGRTDLRLQDVRARQIVDNAVDVCARQADERDVDIETDVAPELHACMNDALVEQAIVNLLDNAVKYSDQGGTVTVSVRSSNGEVCFRVQDRGAGIPEEEQPRIFERFYRVDKGRSRELGGTGLGLSIVKHVADLHGGQVRVDSSPGQGSSFTMCIPA